jgi:hypothetical protein
MKSLNVDSWCTSGEAVKLRVAALSVVDSFLLLPSRPARRRVEVGALWAPMPIDGGPAPPRGVGCERGTPAA